MAVRQRVLTGGWYPGTEESVMRIIRQWEEESGDVRRTGVSCVSPHAGWMYSGHLSFRAVYSLIPDPEAVIIFGGHVPSGYTPIIAREEAFDTPLGIVNVHKTLRDDALSITQRMGGSSYPDGPDNTVEVLLPFIAALFKGADVLWTRVPNDISSESFGREIGECAKARGLRAVAIGSTDLTHYGPNYGFAPFGIGKDAERKVRNGQDARIVKKMEEMDAAGVIDAADEEGSACSAGAAAAAIGFARAFRPGSKGTVLQRAMSTDVAPSDSFVGYCAVSFR